MTWTLWRRRPHQLLWLTSLPPIFFPLRISSVSSLRYRDKDLKDNYCRNPDNRLRPWCYTMDPKTPWEYCNITVCGKGLCTVYTPNLGLGFCGQSLQQINWRPNYCLTLIYGTVAGFFFLAWFLNRQTVVGFYQTVVFKDAMGFVIYMTLVVLQ